MAVDQSTAPDGSIVLKPRCVVDDHDVKVTEAAAYLRLGKDTVRMLCELGEPEGLKAYKLPSKRGNSPWRISWQSVITLKQRNSPSGH